MRTIAVERAPAATVASRLLRAIGVYALATFGVRALNFLLLPLYTRYLSPADYGAIALAEIIASVIVSAAALGSEAALARLYFQYPEGSAEQRDYVASVLGLAFAVVLAAAAAALAFGPRLEARMAAGFSVAFMPCIGLAVGTAAITQVIQFALTLYRLQMLPKPFAMLTSGWFALVVAATVPMVMVWPRGAVGMLAGKLVAAGLTGGAALVLLRRWLRGKFHWRHVRATLPFSLPLMPHQLMALGLVVADRFLLEHYRTLGEVGIYSVAYTCGMAMFLVTTSVMQAWAPMFFDLARAGEPSRPRLSEISSTVAQALIAVAAAGALVAPAFTRLLDARYAAMARLIPLVIAGYLLHAFFALLQLGIMQSKRTGFILYASGLALAANLALNILWIPRWGMFGAAWATVAGYGLEALAAWFFAQRVFPLKLALRRIAAWLALFCLALAATEAFAGDAPAEVILAGCALPLAARLWMEWRRADPSSVLEAGGGNAV